MTLEPLLASLESLMEDVAERAVKRAVARLEIAQPDQPKWLEGDEAARYMGAGYTLPRLKQLAHDGEIIADRKDPSKPNSPYVFLRRSLDEYSDRRVFEIDQATRGNRPLAKK
jgi:hypothetical protein